jgi:CDP-6-deoxy-D-xylo-4-hexulose-3-dehydrase
MGYNLKPLDLQGAVGSVQLLKFDEIHQLRRKNKEKIQSIMEKVPGVRVVNERKEAETSWFGVPIVCDNKELKYSLVAHLEKNKIQTRNYFAGNILLHPGYSHLDDFSNYPEANQVLSRVFFLGCSPTINENMIDYIDQIVSEFINA